MLYEIEQFKKTGELPPEIEFGAWRPKHPEEAAHPNHVNKTPEGTELVPARIYGPKFEPPAGREILVFQAPPMIPSR